MQIIGDQSGGKVSQQFYSEDWVHLPGCGVLLSGDLLPATERAKCVVQVKYTPRTGTDKEKHFRL